MYEPFRPEFTVDPYPHYRRLRDTAPVHFAPEAGLWCVSRYEDVQAVLRADDVFSSRAMFTMIMNAGYDGAPPLSWPVVRFIAQLFLRTWMNPMTFATSRNLIAEDGERHSGMRSVVNRGFTPRRIAAWEKRVREVVDAVSRRRRGARALRPGRVALDPAAGHDHRRDARHRARAAGRLQALVRRDHHERHRPRPRDPLLDAFRRGALRDDQLHASASRAAPARARGRRDQRDRGASRTARPGSPTGRCSSSSRCSSSPGTRPPPT